FALVAEYPEMLGLAQYNLGLVAQRQGDEDRARVHFEQALDTSGDDAVRELARFQLEDASAEAPPPQPSWTAIVDARLGYDDNVLLLADEIQLPDGQSAESG